MIFLGVDSGGTFTDFVLWQPSLCNGQRLQIHKLLSTPSAPEQAILQGIADLNLTQAVRRGEVLVVHGTTVATNAALEAKGVRTVFITNQGFKDLLSIGRQARLELYNLQPAITPPPVPAELCCSIDCRIDAHGAVLKPLTDAALADLCQQIHSLKPVSVAINLLFSYLNPEQEETIVKALGDDYFCSYSADVLPQINEYERGIATWLNAYLGPLVQQYLRSLTTALSPSLVTVMQSNGGTMTAAVAGSKAVNLLLSGPAGGLAAAQFFNQQLPEPGIMTFDMGGTSTDVALIKNTINITNEGRLGPYPIAVPMVDMHTIGAGGGSIAAIDSGGLLTVGPSSAGANPGPACYGLGGVQATVTDANVVLGRLRADKFLAGALKLSLPPAEIAIDKLAAQLGLDRLVTAQGILDLADEHMAQALRVISVQRGYDPKQFRLCSFGGAGGLHVCALAEKLRMHQAMVPIHSGVLSALGMLVAPRERQLCQTHLTRFNEVNKEELLAALENLAEKGRGELISEGLALAELKNEASVDLRYQGQNSVINIAVTDFASLEQTFAEKHQRLYGHTLSRPVELLNLRQRVFLPAKAFELPDLKATETALPIEYVGLPDFGDTQIYWRDNLAVGQTINGPALVCEQIATTLIRPGWVGRIDRKGNIFLDRENYRADS